MSAFRQMTFSEIDFASPEMDEALSIRNDVLRKPLNLTYQEEDITREWNSYHLGAFLPDGQLAGVLVLKPVAEDIVKMRQVAVADNMQRSGIGKALVAFSELYARKKGFTRMELHARIHAVPFYEQMNYRKKGDIFKEVGIDHYFMYKDL